MTRPTNGEIRASDNLSDEVLLAFLEGEVTKSERQAIVAALTDSPSAQRRLRELETLLSDLAHTSRDIEEVDLLPQLRRSIDALPPQPKTYAESKPLPPLRDRPWWTQLWRRQPYILLAMTAAALALVAGSTLRGGDHGAMTPEAARPQGDGNSNGEFRAKGIQRPSEGDFITLDAYRVSGDHGPRALHNGGQIKTSDGLLFAYSNGGPKPFSHLMIFARDSAGEVYWYYPAYQRQGTDPLAIDALPAAVGNIVELPELIHHDYAPGPLTIYALFSRHRHSISAVEAALAPNRSPSADPNTGDTGDTDVSADIAPAGTNLLSASFPDAAQQILRIMVE